MSKKRGTQPHNHAKRKPKARPWDQYTANGLPILRPFWGFDAWSEQQLKGQWTEGQGELIGRICPHRTPVDPGGLQSPKLAVWLIPKNIADQAQQAMGT